MRFFNTRPSDQQRIAILVPIIALGLSLFVVYPKWNEYKVLIPQVEKQQQDLNSLKNAGLPADVPANTALPALPSEPPEFMGEVNQIAAAAHCAVNGFDLKPATATVEVGPIQAVNAQIIVIARYADIRRFVTLLSGAPRMLVITNLAVAPATRVKDDGLASDTLQATVDIERYVTALPDTKKAG